jgi:hypothetical protein
MGPLGIAFAAGATVLVLDKLVDWYKAPKPLRPEELPLVDPKGMPGVVSQLQKGRTYAVRAMFDVEAMAWMMGYSELPDGGAEVVPDQGGASRYLRAIFEQAGFKVLSDPTLRSELEGQKFLGGDPSEWVLTAQWQKSTPYVDLDPAVQKIIPMATFTILPVA